MDANLNRKQQLYETNRSRSELCAGEDYSKYTRLITQMFETFLVYRPSTVDKIIFCQLYEQWINAYLKCCAMNLKRDYVSEIIQDTYHTYKAEISE